MKSIEVQETSVTIQKSLIKKAVLLLISIAGIIITYNIYGIKYGHDLLVAKGYIINFCIIMLGAVTVYCLTEFIGNCVKMGKARLVFYAAFSFLFGLWFFIKALSNMTGYYSLFDDNSKNWIVLIICHAVLALIIFSLTTFISHIIRKHKVKKQNKTVNAELA